MPIRKYDLTAFPKHGIFHSRAAFSMKDRALTLICDGGALFDCDIREYAFNGLPDIATRSLVWKLLLNVYPKSPAKWKEVDEKNLRMYESFVEEFILSKNQAIGKGDNRCVPSPIDSTWKHSPDFIPADEDPFTNESKWSREFGDSAIREIIWKDVERTYSGMPFFQEHNKQTMARLLFVYGMLNSGIGYVQGMNELLAPILFVFAEEHTSECVSAQVEANAFFAFNTLMSETRDLFIHEMDSSSSGMSLRTRRLSIRQGLLQSLDAYLACHTPNAAAHFVFVSYARDV